MARHYETHLYSYAVALTQFALWITPENLTKLRDKAKRHGHTEGECLCVERNPQHYISTGEFGQ